MVAACYRRSGNYQSALNSYAKTHKRFPENTECLKFLIRLCDDMGIMPEAKDYADKLRRIEKTRELNNQRKELRSSSRTSKRSAASSSREGSASSNSSGYVTESSHRINGNHHHHHNRKTSGLDLSSGSDFNRNNDFIVDDIELNERPTTSRRRKALDEDDFEGDEVDAILPE